MSQSAGLEDLSRRVHRIERENRLLQVTSAAMALLLAVLILMAQTRPQGGSIEAQEFVLRDAHGKQRAKLTADSAATLFSLYDANEKVRARLMAGDGPGLLLFDPAQDGPYARIRLALGVGNMGGGADDTGPHLLLWDGGGQPRVEMYTTPTRTGVQMYDAKGRNTFHAP